MTFTAEQLNSARKEGYSDDEIWEYLGGQDKGFAGAKQEGYSLDEVAGYFSSMPNEEEGFLRQAADIPVNIFKGGVTGTRMVTDVFGASNPVSKSLAGVEDYMDTLLSAQARQDQQTIARILKDAEDKGVLDQVLAGVEAFSVAPADTLANAFGTMIPVLATGLAGSVARLAPITIKGVQFGLGVGMGAGTAKGEIYNAVYSELENQGYDPETASKAASEAQAYNGKNLDTILLNAGLGGLAASTGAEKILTNVITKSGGKLTGGAIEKALKGGITEGGLEGLQGGTERGTTNIALQREGVDVPTMRGVVAQATMEGIAGLGMGAAVGPLEPDAPPTQKPPPPKPPPKPPLPDDVREQRNIERDAAKVARELSVDPNDENARGIVNETNRLEQKIENNKVMLSGMEPTSREHQRLSLEIAEDQKNLAALKGEVDKLSEPIAAAEAEQARLAREIAAPPAAATLAPAAQEGAKEMNLQEISESAIAAFPDMMEADGGLLPLTRFTPDEQASLRKAGIVETATTSKGETYEGVNAEYLWQRRNQLQQERAAKLKQAAAPVEEAAPAEPTADVAAPTVEAAPVEPTPVAEAPTVQEGLTVPPTEEAVTPPVEPVAEAPVAEVTPMEEAEFAELRNLMERKGQAENKVAGVKFSKKDEARYNELLPKYRSRLLETITPESDPVVWKDIDGNDIKVSPKGTFYTVRDGRVRTGVAFQPEEFVTDVSPQPVSAAVVESNNVPLPEGYTKQGDVYVYQAPAPAPTPVAETPAAPAAEPAGIAVGNRIKLGKSPQTYTIEEVIPQTETERELGEQYYSVKNERTGKVQTVEANDIKPVKAKGVRKMAARTRNEEYMRLAQDPEANREQLQRMVDEAAKVAGLDVGTPLWRGDESAPTIYSRDHNPRSAGIFLTPDRDAAKKLSYGAEPRRFYVFRGANQQTINQEGKEFLHDVAIKEAEKAGATSVIRKDTGYHLFLGRSIDEHVVFNPNQIKSADPVTYDDQENIIPLEERFQPTSPDIRREAATRAIDESLVVPEGERYTFEQAEAEARKLFGGMPEGFVIVNDSVDKEFEFKAAYEPSTGNIILNLAYIRQGESVRNLIAHELGHYAAGDPAIRAKLQEFLDALPATTRAKLERFVERVYDDETGDIRLEEKQVRAFVQMLKAGDQRNAFQKIIDAIKKWLNDNLGTNFQPTDMDAAAVLSGAINRFVSGEKIAREDEGGILAARPERREQQAGMKGVGKVITTPKGINVRTENIVRSDVFNGDTVSKENTEKAYDIIDKLSGADKEASNKYAEEINDLVRGKLSEEEGRTVEQSIGAVKLGNELFKYAANLAGKGDLRMLQLLTDRFNDLSTGYGSVGAGARDLQARTNLANWVTRASEAQKKGIINAVAIKIYGPNATVEQIKTIEDAINKVNKTKVEDTEEIYTDLETTGEKQGVDIRKAVDRAMDRIPPQNRDPWVVALEVLKDVEGFESFQYVKVKGMDEKKLKQEILAAITRSIKKNLADFQKKMSKKGAEGMEITFWKTMSDEERKIGPLGEVDMAVNRNLSAIVKDTLTKMGLKGAPIDPVKEPEKAKMTLIEQVANILTNNKLTDAKITEADERISAEIASRETAEIKAAEESGADPDVIDMIEAKYSAIREAWDMSMSRQLDIPISDATLRRLIFNRLKDSNVKMSELVQQIKDDPAVGEARKASIVRQIIKELNGINEDGTIQAEYQKLADALNAQLSQMVENNKLKGRMKSAVKAVARDANKPDAQAEKQINKLATLQSDVNEWPQSKEDKVRDIVRNDLKQKLDLGLKVAPKIKAAWIPTLTNNLKKVGVSDATAQTLAELVWRQHEINYMNRKMQQIERAVTGGSLAPIIDAIKSTPLSQQQEAGWKRKVAYDYLINAGLDKQNAARVADLMDLTLQKVLAEAQAKAFYDTVKGTLAEERSRRGMRRFLEAIRTGALDPSKNITSELAEQNGWTGFTPEQYARLAELDTLVNSEDILDLEKATAFKEIQDIIAAAKVPPRVRDTLSSYYVAQALSGIPTATVNIFSPIGYALRYAFTAGARTAIKNPSQLPMVFSSMLSAFKSYTSEVAYSWKNNVQRRGVVEYLANDDKLLELFNKGKKQWEQGKRAEGFKNMLFGSMEYVSRMLKALDEGAISVLEQQGLTRYAIAAMDKAGIKSSEQIAVANMVMKSKQEFILNSIAKGMNKRDAIAFSDDVYRSAWQEALSNLKIDSQEVLDSAINDALAAVGRINTSVDALTGEETKRVSDRGFASSIPIGFLESISKAANSQDANELQRVFYRMIYGFAIVPARVFREAAWFSPYGMVRFGLDFGAKKMGYSSPYAQSLGTDIQRQQRLIETIAGSIVMFGALAMASSSIDDPEDELPFKVVFTGNGPDRRKDPQFFDTWRDKFKPNSINIFFGKTKFSINIERGFEAFAVPFMLAGAKDDWRIRKQFEQTKKTPQDLSDAAIILGSAFMSFNKRGPYSAFIDTYSTASNSDNILASATKQAAFYAKTFIPVVGTSLARNISDFINDPIDKSTLDGALYSNIPVLGPMMGTKSMNAVGQTQGATEFSDRLYRVGIPLVFSLPKNNESEKINQLILKQGQGPSIPTRYNVRQRLGYEPNNKQYEKFVTEYGKYMAKKMTESHKDLMEKSPASYMKWIEKKSETARSIATRAAKEIPNPNSP